jgi:hypothetical protein
MESETVTQNAVAAALAEHGIIVSSLGLLRVSINSSGPNDPLQVYLWGVTDFDGDQEFLWLERRETGWQITLQGGKAGDSTVRLPAAEQQAEICGLVKEWAKPRAERFRAAEREFFFESFSTVVSLMENALPQLPGDPDDHELNDILSNEWMAFLSPESAAGAPEGDRAFKRRTGKSERGNGAFPAGRGGRSSSVKTINSSEQDIPAAVRGFADYIDDFRKELMREANEADDMIEALDEGEAANELCQIREMIGDLNCLIIDWQWNHLRVLRKRGREVPALAAAA